MIDKCLFHIFLKFITLKRFLKRHEYIQWRLVAYIYTVLALPSSSCAKKSSYCQKYSCTFVCENNLVKLVRRFNVKKKSPNIAYLWHPVLSNGAYHPYYQKHKISVLIRPCTFRWLHNAIKWFHSRLYTIRKLKRIKNFLNFISINYPFIIFIAYFGKFKRCRMQ